MPVTNAKNTKGGKSSTQRQGIIIHTQEYYKRFYCCCVSAHCTQQSVDLYGGLCSAYRRPITAARPMNISPGLVSPQEPYPTKPFLQRAVAETIWRGGLRGGKKRVYTKVYAHILSCVQFFFFESPDWKSKEKVSNFNTPFSFFCSSASHPWRILDGISWSHRQALLSLSTLSVRRKRFSWVSGRHKKSNLTGRPTHQLFSFRPKHWLDAVALLIQNLRYKAYVTCYYTSARV